MTRNQDWLHIVRLRHAAYASICQEVSRMKNNLKNLFTLHSKDPLVLERRVTSYEVIVHCFEQLTVNL